jgi:hypothetical protein
MFAGIPDINIGETVCVEEDEEACLLLKLMSQQFH